MKFDFFRKGITFVLFLISWSVLAEESILGKQYFGSVRVLTLQGSHYKMGVSYGKAMASELSASLAILENFFTNDNHISHEQLVQHAQLFYKRFPYNYQLFIKGVAKGAKLPLADAKILNAMETLTALVNKQGSCAYVSVPANQTKNKALLIGRNYDFPPPFDQIAKYLTVTILKEPNSKTTAFIALPGEIYCPTCINDAGLYMELNNGMPSGGSFVEQKRQSLLINMLQILQNSSNFDQMISQLDATESDYSLIINAADKNRTASFEYSSTLGMQALLPPAAQNFVSTNYYLSPEWKDIPKPTDEATWNGIRRRDNLFKLTQNIPNFDVEKFKLAMDKKIEDGGAVWAFTIYQLIFDESDFSLYVKITKEQSDWTVIPLKQLFGLFKQDFPSKLK